MKLVIETRNEVDEVGIELLAQELGVSVQEALKGTIQNKFQQLYDQTIEGNPESAEHSKLTWRIYYE